jgi:hypothetical protein
MDAPALPLSLIEPGMLVRSQDAPEWGLGQVQTRDGWRITVNFEEAGKVFIDGRTARLVGAGDDPRAQLRP